jgi:general secretion pathway protein B
MSYILDALKKSEQERMRGAAPTLHAIHAESLQQPRLMVGHYLLISAVLATAALALWQRPWQAETPQVAFLPAPPPRSEPRPLLAAAAPSQTAVAAHRETPIAVMPKPAHPREKPQLTETVPIKEKKEKIVARAEPPVAAAPVTPQQAPPPKPVAEMVARAPSRQEIIDISELPAAVQRGLPKLAISGYVTNPDDPAGKMVGIGSQILGEGDEVSPGLKLEKIADTAAVFAYKGYRFRVSLP